MAHTEDIITCRLCFMEIYMSTLISHSTARWIPLPFCEFPSKEGSRSAAHDKMTNFTTCYFPQTVGCNILVFLCDKCFPVLIQAF